MPAGTLKGNRKQRYHSLQTSEELISLWKAHYEDSVGIQCPLALFQHITGFKKLIMIDFQQQHQLRITKTTRGTGYTYTRKSEVQNNYY